MYSTNLIVARFNENLEWLVKVPAEYRIIVYNKGPTIECPLLLRRIDRLENRENVGREAETYLASLRSGAQREAEWTVFTQGDPFPHSPDFLELLSMRRKWRDVQPLSLQYLPWNGVPPADLVDREREDWIGDLRIRKELFSLRTLKPAGFFDQGIPAIYDDYLHVHGISGGTNIIEHFLNLASLEEMSSAAEVAEFGKFSYGAIFGIRSERAKLIPEASIAKLYELALSHPVHGYILERVWLHLFGEAFVA